MTNADQKAAIRERMASTGENYTTAKRAIERARGHGRERVSPQDDLGLERAVYAALDQGAVNDQDHLPASPLGGFAEQRLNGRADPLVYVGCC